MQDCPRHAEEQVRVRRSTLWECIVGCIPKEYVSWVMEDAMKTLDLSSGLTLTDSKSETITRNGITITIRSLAEWLLENE
jgi:hypothetical protein